MRVLIAEDEGAMAVNDYDVLVLDRDLPVVHGDDVCRALVGRGAYPDPDAHRRGRRS
jgi:DNA-binding response OmpR family regulator